MCTDAQGHICTKASGRNRKDQKATKVCTNVSKAAAVAQKITRWICRDYGSKVVGEVTLDQVYGGARGIKSLVWEVGFRSSKVAQSAMAHSV